MKGIVLAGGLGTRLYPLSLVLNKHLLPVYDKPMIYYSLSTLMLAGVRDILIISSSHHLPLFQALLGDGNQWGVNYSYAEQSNPGGIAEAFIIGGEFINDDSVCLILGDNIFQGSGLDEKLKTATNKTMGATLFAYQVDNPKAYGVVEFNNQREVLRITEKPDIPKSNYAITGLYFYDHHVVDIAKSISPSSRGELEISDVNNVYLENNQVSVEILGRGFTWLDMGTHQSLLKASNYIEIIESRQGLKIGCPEEVAWRKGYIDDQQSENLAQASPSSGYHQYLMALLEN